MFSFRGKIFGSYAIRKVEMTFHDGRQHLDLTGLHRQHPSFALSTCPDGMSAGQKQKPSFVPGTPDVATHVTEGSGYAPGFMWVLKE